MTFNSVWLSVLTILPPARRLAAWLAAPVLLLSGGAALAANDFNGGQVANCTIDHPSKTYSCSALPLPDYNTVTTIASGYTVVVSSAVTLGYNQTLQMSGTAKLQSSGDIDLAGVDGALLKINGGTLAAAAGAVKLGNQTQTITANVNAQTVSVGSSATKITGTVTASGAISTGSGVTINGAVTSSGGAISLGSDTTINGAVNGASISTSSNVKLSSTLSVGGAINLGSGNTISGAVDGASIKTSSGVGMGALTVTGAADLGSANTINGKLGADSLKTDSGVTINGAVKTVGLSDLGSAIKINGGVDAGSVKTGSPGQINGGIISKGNVDLGSGLTITGNVSGTVITSLSPVSITGNVAASTSFTLPSGSTVNGNITGGALTILDGGSTINGNVTMTGNVYIGSSGRINGDLKAYNVNTHASDAIVSGNAAVNSIYLDFGARVNKTITCTGAAPGAPVCSCVTKAESGYTPTCSATPPAGGAHHIQITHSGQALTCQAQPVTLTACADAACSSIYNGSTTVTLTPGDGAAFSFNGSTSATVRYPTATSSTGTPLSAAVTGISNANVCPNAKTGTNNCNMVFSDNGLPISIPDHVAMNAVALSVQALKSDPSGTCVPLVKNATVDVNFSCQYKNPGSGAASVPIVINNGTSPTNLSCGNSGTSIKLKFDDNGLATPVPTLQYAEVGKVNITAAYAGSGGNANLAASGSTSFIAAPDRFVIEAIRVGGPYVSGGTMPDVPLAASNEPFTLKISAVNKAGVTTKNFGKEDAPESFTIDEKLKFPTNGVDVMTKGSFAAIVDGVGSSSTDAKGPWVFAESGTVTLSAKLANASTYYINTNPSAFKFDTKGTQDVRFVPNHFETALVDGIPMSCAGVSSVANPCQSNETGKFVYSKQGFQLKVIAYNTAASTSISKNYRDLVSGDAVAVAKDITLTAWSAAGGTQAAAVANAATQTDVKFSFVEGTGTAGSVLPMFEFKSGLPDAKDAAAAPVTLFIRAADTDKVTSKRISNPVEAPLTIVGGRMQVTNTYGATSSSLPVEVQALYYSPTARAYVLNSQYSPVSPAVGANVGLDNNVVYTNCTGQLACGTLLVMAPKTLNFNSGKATFRLASPLAAGSVNVTVAPVTTPAWTDKLPSTIPYLPAPTPGRATFGIYRSGPVIYTREVHN